MSIFIGSMKMPESCLECEMLHSEYLYCKITGTDQTGNEYMGKKRSDDCPLKEIVYCKDCKNNWATTWNHEKKSCPRCNYTNHVLDPNDFCSRGERRG